MDPAERARIRTKVRTWVARSLTPAGDQEAKAFFSECEGVADAFVARAGEFDPELPDGDVHQALRNQWVFNSIQALYGLRVSLTPSSFAYSMLYPLTDNWLDAPGRTTEERDSFLSWLSVRLRGIREDDRWKPIARLLDLIEEEFPRPDYPDVHHSLLAIHDAQAESIRLSAGSDEASEGDLLAATLTKGGTSVLADGFLVSGALDEVRCTSVFGYGALLQLIDDLQDLDEDIANGHSTPFVRTGEGRNLEGLTNRLLHFSRRTLGVLKEQAGNRWLVPLIEQSCHALILEAVARHGRFYSPRYLKGMEQYMPVPLDALGRVRSAVRRKLEPAPDPNGERVLV